MQPKAILFDFDYTLGDSTRGIAISANCALNRMGYESVPEEAIRRTIGLSLTNTYQALTGDPDMQRGRDFAGFFREKSDEVMVDNTILLPGAAEMLEELCRQGIRTGIVTTKFHYRIDQILKKFGISNLISSIVGCEDVTTEKPDPEGLLNIIRFLNAGKDEVIYVGDSVVDAETALRAQVKFVAVTTGTTGKEMFIRYPCAAILNSLAELPGIIGTGFAISAKP